MKKVQNIDIYVMCCWL